MINTYLNPKTYLSRKKESGTAALLVSVILLVATILIVIFASNHNLFQTKTSSNQNRYNQAFYAADAGLEYGIVYLMQNRTTILASPSGGFISYTDGTITNVTLANNAKYSIVYTNPIANNYKLIKISSTGVSDDNSSTHVISELVQQGSILTTIPTSPIASIGGVNLGGNAIVTNPTSSITIRSGSTVTVSGSAHTTSSTSGSDKNGLGSDVQQNVSSLQSMTADSFFYLYFGASTTDVKSSIAHVYPSGSSPNLVGMTGTSIWVDQAFSINGGTVGSASNPVLLIVNGNFSMSGNAIIYGFVYVVGNLNLLSGTPQIIGGIAIANGTANINGSAVIQFDNTVLGNVMTQNPSNYFAKVPGTWRDF